MDSLLTVIAVVRAASAVSGSIMPVVFVYLKIFENGALEKN